MMDSAREADEAVVSPGLLASLRSDDLPHLVNYSLWDLGVEGFTDGLTTTEQCEHDENLELLFLASNDYELGAESRESCEEQSRERSPDTQSMLRRFGDPVTSASVEEVRRVGVPPKTRGQTSWCRRVWAAWANERKTLPEAGR